VMVLRQLLAIHRPEYITHSEKQKFPVGVAAPGHCRSCLRGGVLPGHGGGEACRAAYS
jgi:hypothetical protein